MSTAARAFIRFAFSAQFLAHLFKRMFFLIVIDSLSIAIIECLSDIVSNSLLCLSILLIAVDDKVELVVMNFIPTMSS